MNFPSLYHTPLLFFFSAYKVFDNKASLSSILVLFFPLFLLDKNGGGDGWQVYAGLKERLFPMPRPSEDSMEIELEDKGIFDPFGRMSLLESHLGGRPPHLVGSPLCARPLKQGHTLPVSRSLLTKLNQYYFIRRGDEVKFH